MQVGCVAAADRVHGWDSNTVHGLANCHCDGCTSGGSLDEFSYRSVMQCSAQCNADLFGQLEWWHLHYYGERTRDLERSCTPFLLA